MSFGDEIIASGQALTEYRRTGKKIHVVTLHGEPRWNDLWNDLPWIVRTRSAESVDLKSGPGCRPYIRYPFSRERGCKYSGWRVRDNVGCIRLTDEEKMIASHQVGADPFVIVEPNIAHLSNPNKQWGWHRWQELVDRIADLNVVQVGPAGTMLLKGVRHIETRTFRAGAAVLARAKTAVLPEGGLHHAAGVLAKHVVVLFGGAVDENAMGYPWHDNVVSAGPGSPCGNWMPCTHCAGVWASLSVDEVERRARVAWAVGDQAVVAA